MVVASFANLNAKYRGRARTVAVRQAAAAHAVSTNFVFKYGLQAEMGEGFFEESTWGKNTKTAWKLADIDVYNKCLNYCKEHNGHQRKGQNLTAGLFVKWLKTEFDMEVSTSQGSIFLGRLGGSWESVKKGCYVDNHEAPHALRHEREFLNNYNDAYRGGGANFLEDIDKDLCADVVDWSRDELKASPLPMTSSSSSSPSPSPSPSPSSSPSPSPSSSPSPSPSSSPSS